MTIEKFIDEARERNTYDTTTNFGIRLSHEPAVTCWDIDLTKALNMLEVLSEAVKFYSKGYTEREAHLYENHAEFTRKITPELFNDGGAKATEALKQCQEIIK